MLRIKTTRRQPLSARSVWVSSPDILAALNTRGFQPAKGRAELDTETPAGEGEMGALDLELIIKIILKELAKCHAEQAQLRAYLERTEKS